MSKRTQITSNSTKDSDFSTVHFDNAMHVLITKEIKQDVLPNEEIQVPEWELPPVDNEGEQVGESIREKEEKWTDLSTKHVR
ncbi:anaphase-promoting complex subunit 13-like [Clytia hemisphaerica]|uniref:anaphase-promoting complex subunit 13-like n=1 Tax=Clytia hemisphaerica TaxID=252671 RepID=UPI0034D76BBA